MALQQPVSEPGRLTVNCDYDLKLIKENKSRLRERTRKKVNRLYHNITQINEQKGKEYNSVGQQHSSSPDTGPARQPCPGNRCVRGR